jgi:hypothetical protein
MGAFGNKSATDCDIAYKSFLSNGGNAIVLGGSKYIGGHAAIRGERKGELVVNSAGVFFNGKKSGCYFYLPVTSILRAAFETGEEISRNAVFSRLLAISGFVFAYKQRTRVKHMFLTIDYVENGSENVVLLETQMANEFASAIARVRQETNVKKDKEPETEVKTEQKKSVSELMIEINELRALGILTTEEFIEKKRDLLSRI